MKVVLTFDVEIWCGGWDGLDQRFPTSFDRYVFGRSSAGDFALPRTLAILKRHGLRGVFFVESLFAARFGIGPLRTIVDMIGSAGHEIQLHLHPEWADEASPALVPSVGVKRPYMHQYSCEDQRALIKAGMALLREAGAPSSVAFRSGGFAAGHTTFGALASCGIKLDFSIDATMPNSVPEWRGHGRDLVTPQSIDGVNCYPMAVFRDGFGRLRHAQVGACSGKELTEAMDRALNLGWESFVVLSHNFEMLKPGTAEPDVTVVRRFEALCAYLEHASGTLPVHVTSALRDPDKTIHRVVQLPVVSRGATARRIFEQLSRRIS